MFGLFKKKNNSTKISKEEKRYIIGEERYQRDIKLDYLQEKYKSHIKEYTIITNKLWDGLYSKAINQKDIFNKYSERYLELCNQLLQILPTHITMDKEFGLAYNQERNINHCTQDITNMIRLLEKQEKYNEIINVCRYLLSLQITEDGTKKGIKGRIEKAVIKFNQKYNTNYTYQINDDLIIDLTTGEIME